jgi:hypothetical protein
LPQRIEKALFLMDCVRAEIAFATDCPAAKGFGARSAS